MSGVYLANSRRARKHTFKYFLLACIHFGSFLSYYLLIYAISRLASLQVSVNHGARVFPHLFGFLGYVIVISFTTPAPTASCNRKSSTAAALSSLLCEVSCTKIVNFAKNSGDLVCCLHVYADVA
jgi:membrane associated rhomboid family serine protease